MRLPLSLFFLSALWTVLIAAPVQAQTEQWSDAQQVVVRTHVPGPALWRVQKNGAEVIIIGILPVFPKSQGWTTKRIENALKGARLLITPATSSASVGDMFTLMSAKNLPQHQDLKSTLPPALYARYAAVAARASVSTKPFAHDRPVWAGARLRRDVLARLDFTDQEPQATIVRLAHRAGVPVRAAAHYRFSPLMKDINAMSEPASEACLSDALDDIEFDMDRAPKAAAAWAVGDIRTVHANYQGSSLMKCLAGSDQAAALLDHSIDDAAAAMSEALKTPGRSVAILPLSILLRKNGVLDRLDVQGARISSPDY
ncbi:MAG: TraB/GumN family protein [Asticcacaulis sp.]